eukprot:TRINITY_DN9909_c0_g1_i1.p1 TRINITY_DN9909_c0_g1~~TRINITY_DN9909_c0_g1_i1.p1  ORF type:complete len:281 (+),score=26.26 TRINITY_DN9909_c0_g1_i1:182-1024(+)
MNKANTMSGSMLLLRALASVSGSSSLPAFQRPIPQASFPFRYRISGITRGTSALFEFTPYSGTSSRFLFSFGKKKNEGDNAKPAEVVSKSTENGSKPTAGSSAGPASKIPSDRLERKTPKEIDLLVNERVFRRPLMPEESKEAEHIGYQIIGPAVAKESPWGAKSVFAIVEIGSHQFKVSGGDVIYVEKLKYPDVNQKIMLKKVMLLGTKSQTIIGRPIIPGACVHAVVEQHALSGEVIVFKKKRRKNYRRCKTHSQELTRLRILGVEGLGRFKDGKLTV